MQYDMEIYQDLKITVIQILNISCWCVWHESMCKYKHKIYSNAYVHIIYVWNNLLNFVSPCIISTFSIFT